MPNWEFLGESTLGSAGDSINVPDLTPKTNLSVFVYTIRSGNCLPQVQLNGDTNTNYTWAGENNFSGTRATSGGAINSFYAYTDNQFNQYANFQISNVADQYKMINIISVSPSAEASSNTPNYRQGYATWFNDSDQVTRLNIINVESGNFGVGSFCAVFGCD
mgnify:FL=1